MVTQPLVCCGNVTSLPATFIWPPICPRHPDEVEGNPICTGGCGVLTRAHELGSGDLGVGDLLKEGLPAVALTGNTRPDDTEVAAAAQPLHRNGPPTSGGRIRRETRRCPHYAQGQEHPPPHIQRLMLSDFS